MFRAILLLFFFLIALVVHVKAQTYFKVDPDSVRIIHGELLLKNQSRNIKGALSNEGEGVTRFAGLQLRALGDSAVAIAGQDTLDLDHSGKSVFYVLSNDIPALPAYYYHPLAFEAPLDSGRTYHVHALVSVKTHEAYDNSAVFRTEYSNQVNKEKSALYKFLGTKDGLNIYSFEYDKVILSVKTSDTLKISFSTTINDITGKMRIDSLSYMKVEQFDPAKFSR